jgi:hypothetical protein
MGAGAHERASGVGWLHTSCLAARSARPGGGHLGEDDEAILIDRDSDADRAIAILATLGIDARRG